MASLSIVIVPAKALKDGRHKVRISVAHNGETRYIVTDIILDSAREFKNGFVVKRADAAYLNTKLQGMVMECREQIDSLGYVDGLTCSELLAQMKNASAESHKTIRSVYNEYINNSDIKESSRNSYDIVWRTISSLINVDAPLEGLNYGKIMAMEKKMQNVKKLKPTTIRNYMTFFITLINYAKRCGYVHYRVDPFGNYTLPKMEVRDSWLSVEEIRKIRDCSPKRRNVRLCRDLFMLSFYLGGINIADLLNIDFKLNANSIKYERRKTEGQSKVNKYVEFEIPKEAKEIINRIINKDGSISISKTTRENRLREIFQESFPKLAKEAGVEKIIYYSARKSFSQQAFELGVNTQVIDYILGHSLGSGRFGGSSLYHYVAVTPEMASEVIRKVIDNLNSDISHV